jgi:uncharacterized protein YuzE
LIGPFSLAGRHRDGVRVVVSFEQEPARASARSATDTEDRQPDEINGHKKRRTRLRPRQLRRRRRWLYLSGGESAEAPDAALTPEGHGIRYDAEGRVMGVTIINARLLLERDGHFTITLPREVRVDANDLAGALS